MSHQVQIGTIKGNPVLLSRHSWGPDTVIEVGGSELAISYVDAPASDGKGRVLKDVCVIPPHPESKMHNFYHEAKEEIEDFVARGNLQNWIKQWAKARPKPEAKSDDEEFERIHGYEEDHGDYGDIRGYAPPSR